MTYEEMANWLRELTPEQRQYEVTVFLGGEFYTVHKGEVNTPQQTVALDIDHPFLIAYE